ncbi:golgin subfamily A member 4 [Ahaetulla prasina]|uniref:golgin subfamily A member 4 n=1 Tax=Ahaetulla prasina TaxID=499056 RepID=UPI0026474912|nr:golgin subfamily A member 4 [Ahaetulla prasina]
MNATKQLKQKTIDNSFPGTRKKGGKHGRYEANPMVLMPAAPKETITQYSLSLTSGNKDRMFDEMDMLRNITTHLNEIVHTMEGVYIKEGEVKESKEEEEEEEEELPEDYEDMTSFLICCSQLRTQLENALREEKQILESLLKWFEKEVHEMEELGEEEIIPDWQVPLADKSITNNINQLLNRIQRLEELKGRVQELPKLIQISIPKQEKKKAVSPTPPTPKDPKNIIEELATRHLTEDVMNMVQVFQEESGQPQTIEMMNNRMIEIMKVFERQTNKLHRVVNEQDVLEGKLQKIQQEFQKLTEEKEIMEDELQKMKTSEQVKGIPETRKKILKLERVKIEEKPQVPSEKAQVTQKPESGFGKERDHIQMKEDLNKAQEDIQSLQEEKKMLEEQLQKALQEVEKAKIQLAEIPPTIPDWQFPLSAGVEELPKKGKKTSKGKAKDEVLPRKSQELSKQKGSAGVTEKLLKPTSQPEDTDKKKEETKKIKSEMVDSKDVPKAKDSSEMKKRRLKGAGNDVSIEEKQQLPDSAKDEEKILPVILDKHVEMLPPDSKSLKEEIAISPQEHVPSAKQKTLQITPEFKMKDTTELKPLTLQKEIPRRDIDSVELQREEESHHLISKSMLQLKDHLTKLKGMPEAETLAKLLLESDKGKLPERQKLELLQMLNHLVTPDEIQQAVHIDEKEKDEKKRTLLANIVSVIRPLLQEQPPKADLSEKERNDLAEERTILFSILDSRLKDYQKITKHENIEAEIRKLSEERTQLRANVELNMKDLEQARALASSQPSEINENRVKELEKQGALLVDNLEANQEELESARFLEEKKIDKLAKQSLSLLAILKSNIKELEETEALAATEPSIITDLKIKELTELRNEVAEHLEHNLQNIERAWSHAPGLTIESRLKEEELEELHELSELKQQLLESLESNQKALQEIQELAAAQTCSDNEHRLQELSEQRSHLTIELEATLDGIQDICHRPAERTTFIQPSEKELYDLHKLSEKKGQLLDTLESNWRELEEVQELAAIQPSNITAHKLQELTEQRKQVTTELEATLDGIQNICRQTTEISTFIPPSEKEVHELYELSEKKQQLLEALESNQKELHEIHGLEATQLGSINAFTESQFGTPFQTSSGEDGNHRKPEHKLQVLTEQKKFLTMDLEATLDNIQNVCRHSSERITFIQPSEKELHELNELAGKKHQLLKTLESKQKELQEIQECAPIQPDSVSEHKLQELNEQRRNLTIELEATLDGMQNVCCRASEKIVFIQPTEKELNELHELSEKKHQLLEMLGSNRKELQEIQELVAIQPGSVSEHKLQELTEQRIYLTSDLEAAVFDIQNICRHASERTIFVQSTEKELHELQELTKKKEEILETLESNWKELQEIQELAATQPDSISEYKLQELTEQRRHLATDLEAILDDIQNVCHYYSERTTFIRPSEKELHELLMKEQQLLEKVESNEKELQDAKALATTQPGTISDYKVQELTKQRRSLIANLETITHEIQTEFTSEGVSIVHPDERELYELSGKREEILAKLESVQKELDEASASAAAHPGSVSEHILHKLSEEKRHLIEELGQTTINLLKAKSVASERGIIGKSIEKELPVYDLLRKKKELQEKLRSNEKEIEEAQILASIHPGIINEHALQELVEAKRHLITDLKATVHDIQKAEHALEMAQIERPREIIQKERSLNHLLRKKELLQKRLDSNWTELEDIQALIAPKPGYSNEYKLQLLSDERSNLSKELKKVFQEILALQQDASEKFPDRRYGEKELYTLSEKKQLLLENLKKLQEAQALAVAQPGDMDENKQKQLTEQRKHLTAELETIVKNIRRVEHSTSEILLDIRASEKDLHDLLEKKFEILEDLAFNQKELQKIQVLAAVHPDSTSDFKLQDLTSKNRHLTECLEATEQDIQEIHEIQITSSETIIVTRPSDEKLYALSEKKEHLLETLESKEKELKEAETLEISQPGIVSAHKLQELNEQRRHLSVELEATVYDIQEIEDRASEEALMRRSEEIKLHKLCAWKKVLLEHLESNLELQEEIQTMEPDNTTEKRIEELHQQRKILIENLEAVVEDIDDIKSYISETGGIIKYVERDLETLHQKKQMFLECLEINLNNLQEAQTVAVTLPSRINEQKIIDLTNERKLLIAGLEAVIQDLQDMQGITKEKVKKSKKQLLEELCEQKELLLEKLSSNLKDLKQAQALAAAQPGSINEQKIQEFNEQRRLLSIGLDGIVQNIQIIQNLKSSKTELLTSGEIQRLYEKRRLYLDNMELNLKDLKVLQGAAVTQPDNEQIMQQLAEKKIILFDNLEGIIQAIEQEQNLDLEKGLKKRSDEREIHELLVFSALDSKCYELEEMGTLPYNQLDVIKRKVHNLKEQRKRSFDRRRLVYPKEHPTENMLEKQKEALKEFLQQRKHLFSYLRSSIENLQQKSIAWQDMSDENIAKQRSLAAKLQANMRDIQAAFEKTQKIEKSRVVESRQQFQPLISQKTTVTQPSYHQLLMAKVSSLQITKAPMIRHIGHEETSLDSAKSEERPISSLLEQRSRILGREVDMSSRSKLIPQSLHNISSFFPFDISKFSADIALHELLEYNRTLLPGHKANLRHAWQLAQRKILQQQANLAEKFRGLSVFLPQPGGTTRFQDYSAHPLRPAWEANQLSQKSYPQKLSLLKRRLLGPEIKNNIKGATSSAFQGLTNQVQDVDSFIICGKRCSPPRKDGPSPVIGQNSRSH